MAGTEQQQQPLLAKDKGATPLLPQFFGIFTWNGYDEDEACVGRRLRRLDYFGLLVMAALYTALAWSFTPTEVGLPSEPPFWVLCLQILCTVITMYVVYLDAATPTPLKNMVEVYGCLQGPLARYIFLTRQTMALQFVHESVTLISQLAGWRLLLGTDVLSPVVGGAGAFITIQFFILVFPDKNFCQDCHMWLSRGFSMKVIASVLHMPQLPLAIVDICVLRYRPSLLTVMPNLLSVVIAFFVYAITYVGVIHWNHGLTGHWPYGILEPLGKSVVKWVQFTCFQGCILAFFGGCLWELARVLPVLW